jgi:peptidoglycan/xylan/chitin deacetylase (PgdA/CDA1 family)
MSSKNIPILMYHSIESMPRETVMRSLHVPPRRFEFQMMLLKILGYKALSISKLKPYLNGEKNGKVIGVTFDDGYENNLLNAAPILQRYNFSATCYLVSSRIGTSNIWDKDKGISQRPLMTKNQVMEWISMGMDIGAHTKSHPDLTIIDKNELFNEINGSKIDLEDCFQVPVNDFCYPFGRFNELIVNAVKDAGYSSGTSMMRGKVYSNSDRFTLPRIPINHHTLPHLFLTKLFTKYEERRA